MPSPPLSLSISRLRPRRQILAQDLAAQLLAGSIVMWQPAGRRVVPVVSDQRERRGLGAAPVHHIAAPGMERTTGWQRDRAWRLAGDWPQPLPLAAVGGQRLEQPLGIRMMIGGEHGRPVGLLHY